VQTSYSKIALYRTCPKQYEYAYVKELPRSISQSESYGSSIHNTLKQWGELEVQHQTTEDAQLTMFAEEQQSYPKLDLATLEKLWQKNFIRSTYKNTNEAIQDEQKGYKALQHFFEWWKNKERTICTIESGFSLPLHNHAVKGRFDRIEQDENGLHIIDFKTGSPKDVHYVDENLQLTVYVDAAEVVFKQPVHTVSLVFINEDQTVQVDSKRSAEQRKEAKDILFACLTNIEHEEYTATPSLKACTYCPYKNVCKDSIATT
jgi:RecB family exonuclease